VSILQELNTLRARTFSKKVSPGRVVYSFDTKKGSVEVHFLLRHTGLEAYVGFGRSNDYGDLTVSKDENSDSMEVFATLPLVLKQFEKDYPNVRFIEFMSHGKRMDIYKRMLTKVKGWKLSRSTDVAVELVKEGFNWDKVKSLVGIKAKKPFIPFTPKDFEYTVHPDRVTHRSSYRVVMKVKTGHKILSKYVDMLQSALKSHGFTTKFFSNLEIDEYIIIADPKGPSTMRDMYDGDDEDFNNRVRKLADSAQERFKNIIDETYKKLVKELQAEWDANK
jgi:hypothetical protein